MASRINVCIESGSKRVFASALDWPGWCRSAKTEELALDALVAYVDRYAPVVERAQLSLPKKIGFDVIERLPGSGATDFGVPDAIAEYERQPSTPKQTGRLLALVSASWSVFDDIAADTPEELRKGPRGGGRDRDKMIGHVLASEQSYARTIGVRYKEPDLNDTDAIEVARDEIIEALRSMHSGAFVKEKGWPTRYAARRIAWHVLDHAWEMQDKSNFAVP